MQENKSNQGKYASQTQRESQGRLAESRSTLTKADIVDRVYEKIGFSKKEATDLVELVFSSLKEKIVAGKKVKISGFGNFVVRAKNPRKGRNPQTGETIEISARRVLNFRPSQVLKAQLNGEALPAFDAEDED